MRKGIGQDWTGAATLEYEIIDETISGKYVLRHMPFEITRLDGSKYMAQPVSGLFLRDKSEVRAVEDVKGEK